ncbi:condensation domain-containing protein [Streptomyces sp. SBC-4]|nr:condensation domain-containing protein [Streptomyces sp. SBC-4]MDV5142800.1 condensation domain-containing protein [Streptomyces sp. SBC-4]
MAAQGARRARRPRQPLRRATGPLDTRPRRRARRTPLPTDRPRLAGATHRAGTVPFHLPPDSFRHLSSLALRHGASTFMVLHAALAGFLRRLGAGTDILVGSPVAGRTDVGLDDLVGCFVNTVVIRTDTSGDPDFHDLLQQARVGVTAALDHQDVPFEQVVEAVNPARSAARHPLFQVMLSLQNNAGAAVRLPTSPPACWTPAPTGRSPSTCSSTSPRPTGRSTVPWSTPATSSTTTPPSVWSAASRPSSRRRSPRRSGASAVWRSSPPPSAGRRWRPGTAGTRRCRPAPYRSCSDGARPPRPMTPR